MFIAGNFTLIIASLRILLEQNSIDGYIVPSGDAHYVRKKIIRSQYALFTDN